MDTGTSGSAAVVMIVCHMVPLRVLAHGVPVRISTVRIPFPVRLVINLILGRISDILLPVLRPVQVLVPQLGRSLGITAHNHTVDHASNKRPEAKDQEDYSQDVHKHRFHKLNDDNESQSDQNQTQVDQQHQTTDALCIGTEGIRCTHRFNPRPTLPGRSTGSARLCGAGHGINTSRPTS